MSTGGGGNTIWTKLGNMLGSSNASLNSTRSQQANQQYQQMYAQQLAQYGHGFTVSSSALSTSSSFTIGHYYSTSTLGVWAPQRCESVTLSSKDGVTCGCGKCAIGIDALPIKSVILGEVRQVVGSAFKLAHGWPLGEMKWSLASKDGK